MRIQFENAVVAEAAVQVPSMTERAISRSLERQPDDFIEIGVELDEITFDFDRIAKASDSEREDVVNQRRAQLTPSQDAIVARIAALGGEVLGRMWLANVLDVRVPASAVAKIARLPGVVAVSVSEEVHSSGWNGRQVRSGLLLDGAGLANNRKDFYQGWALLAAESRRGQDSGKWYDFLYG